MSNMNSSQHSTAMNDSCAFQIRKRSHMSIKPRLKKILRLSRYWGPMVSAAICLCLVAVQSRSEVRETASTEVRAQRFVLVDKNGKVLGEWGVNHRSKDGQSFVMFDPEMRKAIQLSTHSAGADIWVTGAKGYGAVRLSSTSDGGQVSLYSSCPDPSHENSKNSLVRLRAESKTGSIQVKECSYVHDAPGTCTISGDIIWQVPERK